MLRSYSIVLSAVVTVALLASGAPRQLSAQGTPTDQHRGSAARRPVASPERDYLLYVVAESADQVALVRYGPGGIRIEREQRVGMMPTEINGPHGIDVSPDGQFYYVSIAHGTPYGTFWKYRTTDDQPVGHTTLGLFPATVQLTPDGSLAFVANFNLHGDMVPSSVSVVSTNEMVEIARITTCTMPHGSRLSPDGTRQYSACMMDDLLVEIDTRTLGVSRHFQLARGRERGMDGAPSASAHAGHMPGGAMPPDLVQCSPTWAQPGADGRRLYVACNKSDEIVEVDVERWAVTRRWAAGDGVYNLAVSPNGAQLVATNKRGKSISVFDLATAKEVVRLPTVKGVVHGVVVSPDNRYAFVTQEGRGSEAGILEVFDLQLLRSVASIELGQQAAGVAFLRMEPTR